MSIKKNTILARVIVGIIAILLLIPIIATLIYSFATEWVKTIFPSGLTLKWYAQLVSLPDFFPSVFRSLLVGIITVILAMIFFLPVIFYVNVYEPKLKEKIRYIMITPYAIPGIILVTGMMQLYTNLPIPKLFFLIITLTAISFPAFYQSLNNVFIGQDFLGMYEQARLLGEKPIGAFLHVILPNIKSGLLVGMLLTFTAGFSEYVITNIFLTGEYETFKLFMYRLMSANGNAASVLTIIYFIFLALIAIALIRIINKE